MSSDDDSDLDADYLGRKPTAASSTATAAAAASSSSSAAAAADPFSLTALLARREAHQLELQRVASALGGDAAAPGAVESQQQQVLQPRAQSSNGDMCVDSPEALRSAASLRQAAPYADVRLLTSPLVVAASHVAPLDAALVGPMQRLLSDHHHHHHRRHDDDDDKCVRLRCAALDVPSRAKDNELLRSGALLHALPDADGACSPALLNYLLWRVVHARDDLLTTTRCAELAAAFLAANAPAPLAWAPAVADWLAMLQALGVRAVVSPREPSDVLRLAALVWRAPVPGVALPSAAALPLDNLRLLADVLASAAPRLVADDDAPLLLRALLSLLADARLERVHRALLLAVDALFDAHGDGGAREHALALEAASCSDDAAALHGVLRRLPLTNARVRRVSGRASLIALTALSGGPERDAAECLRAADASVRDALAGDAPPPLARLAVEAFEQCARVPLRMQQESQERVTDCDWLMACAFLADTAMACDARLLRGAQAKQLQRFAQLLQSRSAAVPEVLYSPLISLAKTRLGALRAKASMLAGIVNSRDEAAPTLHHFAKFQQQPQQQQEQQQ